MDNSTSTHVPLHNCYNCFWGKLLLAWCTQGGVLRAAWSVYRTKANNSNYCLTWKVSRYCVIEVIAFAGHSCQVIIVPSWPLCRLTSSQINNLSDVISTPIMPIDIFKYIQTRQHAVTKIEHLLHYQGSIGLIGPTFWWLIIWWPSTSLWLIMVINRLSYFSLYIMPPKHNQSWGPNISNKPVKGSKVKASSLADAPPRKHKLLTLAQQFT